MGKQLTEREEKMRIKLLDWETKQARKNKNEKEKSKESKTLLKK